MALKKVYTLLSAADITSSSAGTAVVIEHLKSFSFVGYLTVAAITGTSPTLDVVIQHSFDNVTWATLVSFTQLTGASGNSKEQKFAASATDYLKPILPYVRASYTIGGSSTPTFNDVTVKLIVDG